MNSGYWPVYHLDDKVNSVESNMPYRQLPYALFMLVVSILSMACPRSGLSIVSSWAGTVGHPVHDTFMTLGILELWLHRAVGTRKAGLIEVLRITALSASIVLSLKLGIHFLAKGFHGLDAVGGWGGQLLALGQRPDGTRMDGFPSGHTCAVTMLAWLLTDKYPKFGVFFYGLSGLIAYSRWESSAHYGFQVLAGAILGIAIVVCTQNYRIASGMVQGTDTRSDTQR